MLASIAAAGAAQASSSPCFQASLRGVLFSSVTGAFTSPVKLSVRSTTRQGALLLFGSYRCAHDTDHLLAQIERALRPGGLFALNDYVDERRLQYEADRLAR